MEAPVNSLQTSKHQHYKMSKKATPFECEVMTEVLPPSMKHGSV